MIAADTTSLTEASRALPGKGGAAVALSSVPTPIGEALFLVDSALFVAGAIVLVILVIRFLARREDPLRAAPPRPNVFREDSVALVVVVYLVAALGLSLCMSALAFEDDAVVTSIVVGSGAQVAGAVACLVLTSRQFEGGVRRLMSGPAAGLQRRGLGLAAALSVAGVGLCPAVGALTVWTVTQFAAGYRPGGHPTLDALEQGQPTATVAALWAGALLVAPVAEELFFRGVLQTVLVGLLRSRWWGIAAASLAFGFVHLSQPHAVPALVLLGVLIGYVFERTGSLLPAVVIHVLFNGKTLIWEALL